MSTGDTAIRFSVSLPATLLGELDRRVVQRGYASRSELVRDLIREKIVEEKWEDDGEDVVGVLVIVFDHHQKDLAEKVIHAQHRRHVNILCSTHVHMDHSNCLETIIIRGRPSEIGEVAIEIGGLRGIRLAKLTKASTVDL